MANRIKIYFIYLVIIIAACGKQTNTDDIEEKEQEIVVYNFDNKKAFERFKMLNLDATHKNLLNPNVAKEDMDKVIESWTQLHQEIGNFYKDKNFDWGTSDTLISVLDRIYFDKNGKIKTYFFNVLSESVPKEKTEAFGELIAEFAKEHTIAIKRDSAFAQCGKVSYWN